MLTKKEKARYNHSIMEYLNKIKEVLSDLDSIPPLLASDLIESLHNDEKLTDSEKEEIASLINQMQRERPEKTTEFRSEYNFPNRISKKLYDEIKNKCEPLETYTYQDKKVDIYKGLDEKFVAMYNTGENYIAIKFIELPSYSQLSNYLITSS